MFTDALRQAFTALLNLLSPDATVTRWANLTDSEDDQ